MKNVLLIVSGSIAAYKACDVARGLIKAGCNVIPVLTTGAEKFITPLLMQALTSNEVSQELFNGDYKDKMDHIHLAREADLILVCPATANTLAKAAEGRADNLATALLLSATCPVMYAPAMNHSMLSNAITQDNIHRLKKTGAIFIEPTAGELACGEVGDGKLAEVDTIVNRTIETLGLSKESLMGTHIVITAGPTYEPIDPVRFIGNRSSGKQGYAITESLLGMGAHVSLITGPSSLVPPRGAKVIHVETALEMQKAVKESLDGCQAFIGTAAVSDWRVEHAASEKIKKYNGQAPQLNFIENPDILASVAESTNRPKLVIGFCAESSNLKENALTKLSRKKVDWILANNIVEHPFGGDNNEVLFCTKEGTELWKSQTKNAIARQLVLKISDFLKK